MPILLELKLSYLTKMNYLKVMRANRLIIIAREIVLKLKRWGKNHNEIKIT